MTDKTLTPAEELQALRERRRALERLVRVAQVIERLHRGLEAALLLGQTPRELAHKAQGFLRHLDQQTLIQPTRDLQTALGSLDREVQAALARIMAFARGERELGERIAAEVQPSAELGEVFALLGRFRRSAQTAVALRLLLRDRGVSIAPVRLEIAREEIQAQILVLKEREGICRTLVRDEIAHLQSSLEGLLADDRLAEGARTMLRSVLDDLNRNLAHLEAGGSVDELPVAVEVIELAEALPAPVPVQPAGVSPPSPAPGPATPRRVGLLRHLWLWLTGPWRQGWKDIEK